MLTLETIVKVVIASSILVVWVFRFDNIVKEFKQYELSDLMRTIVGASKIILATLLVVSIWHEEYVVLSAAAMGFLMIVAQYFHFKVKKSVAKTHSLFVSFDLMYLSDLSKCLIIEFTYLFGSTKWWFFSFLRRYLFHF
jgi:hypothetical protein